jgi:hypothetical protein
MSVPNFIYFLMGGMLIAGTMNTLILKMQNSCETDYEGKHWKEWNHPFF